jgi:2-isopropylmalate synthase
VFIESTDGHEYWTNVGVAVDIIQASCRALMDSIEYKLHKSQAIPKIATANAANA